MNNKTSHRNAIEDLSGRRFGKLTVLEQTDRRSGYSVVWKCKCDCGNTTFVSARNLKSGGTVSCGCHRREMAVKNLAKDPRANLGIVDKTNLSKIASGKPQRNSTTGVRGVTRLPDGRYEAYIHLKGKRFRIGRYSTLDEAHVEREKAEERYFKPLLDEWERRKQKK